MASRGSLDDKLAAIRAFRNQSLDPEAIGKLRKWIGDRSNLVVAAAASIAGENSLVDLAKDLEAAFDRFLVNPLKDDKICRAKIAALEALDKIESQKSDVFLRASKYVQLEPVWNGSEDTAAPLRAAAIVALARIEGVGSLPLLVDAMADPEKDVRIASAIALGAVGTDAAGLVLRLKARIGDKDPDVLSECLAALLIINAKENLSIVVEWLNPGNPACCEAAALALGKSRLAEALGPLKDCLQRAYKHELRQPILLAIAILRRPEAIDYLLELVASEPEPTALSALSALRIFKDDPRLRERVASVVGDIDSRSLQTRFDRDFR